MEHINSSNWQRKTAVGEHISDKKHEVNVSGLKLIQPISSKWKMEYYEAIHIQKHIHEDLLNMDEGNVTSLLLYLFTQES